MTPKTTDHPPELEPSQWFPPETIDGGAAGLMSGLVVIAFSLAILAMAVALVIFTISTT
jgi:hypothetical protein